MTGDRLPLRAPDGTTGTILFLNCGDPPGSDLEELVLACDRRGIAAVELAVPFPDSPTDGPTVRRSAARALSNGADLDSTLAVVSRLQPRLTHTKIVLLVDWAWSLAARAPESLAAVAASGAAGILIHGLPARHRATAHELAADLALPVVTTCYHGRSTLETVRQAAEEATAYVYLVSRFGRSGGAAPLDTAGLAATVQTLRRHGPAPVALGFGIKGRREIAQVTRTGADAAILGSAAVDVVEQGLQHHDLHGRFGAFLDHLLPASPELATPSPAPAQLA